MSNKVVAVWGSPGSGCTVTSVKIARELANAKKNVILVLCDDVTPMVPLIYPDSDSSKSIGSLLEQPILSPIHIFQNLVPVKNLSLLGYQSGDNEITYAEYNIDRARALIALLKKSADYVIIDCCHHLLASVLTAAALKDSDVVLRVVNADLKSLIYLKSQKYFLLKDAEFRFDQHISVINNMLPTQDYHPYQQEYGAKAYMLPHVTSLKVQYDEARLLESLPGRDAKLYEPVIKKITQEVIVNE